MPKRKKRSLLIPAILIILFLIVFPSGCEKDNREKEIEKTRLVPVSETRTKTDPSSGPLNANFFIEDKNILLDQGKASHPAAPGSAAIVETSIFGAPQYGDLNNDGLADAVLFLKQDSGGTGFFFYAASAIFNGTGWIGSRAIFIGDRIIPESIEIDKGLIIIRYLDRKPEDPFSAPPTIGKKLVMTLEGNDLVESSYDY